MSEQEAVAGLYSLGQASPGYLDVQENLPSLGVTSIVPEDGSFTREASRQLSEELHRNRPVIDENKNYAIQIVTPHSNDVLSGRGNGVNHHEGNIYFRSLIQKYKPFYLHSNPSEKKLISKRIVQDVQNRDPPGRFLKQSDSTELWNSLELEKVLKKTGQALREKAPELKKKAKEDLIKSRAISSTTSHFQNSNLDFSSPTNQDLLTFSSPNVTAVKLQKPISCVVVPSLKYVKEDVNPIPSKNSDPPGIFYNYYSSECNDDTESSLFVTSMTGNDPPGQFANVISSESLDDDSDITMIVDDLGASNQKRTINQDKSLDIITQTEKRVKLEP